MTFIEENRSKLVREVKYLFDNSSSEQLVLSLKQIIRLFDDSVGKKGEAVCKAYQRGFEEGKQKCLSQDIGDTVQ